MDKKKDVLVKQNARKRVVSAATRIRAVVTKWTDIVNLDNGERVRYATVDTAGLSKTVRIGAQD